MDGGLSEVKDYSLSDGDLRQLLGDDIKIFTYPQLKHIRDANELFDRRGRCIVLFLTESENSGHWVCMLRKKKGIEYFDPYGEAPEDLKDEIPQSRLEALDESQPHLMRLLRRLKLPVYYNTHQFQQKKSDIATCGRHCAVRLLYAPKSLVQYRKIIQMSGLSPDDFVAGVSFDKLGK